MKYSKTKKVKKANNKLFLAVAFLLVIGGLTLAWQKSRNQNSTGQADTANTDNSINFDPPTEDEQQASNERKEELINADESPNSNEEEQSGQKIANVIITYAKQSGSTVEVNAFVNDIYQDGTCTITFRKGTLTVSKEAPAYPDASSTICTNPNFKQSDFPSGGTWSVRVTYESTDVKGQSESQDVIISK